MRSTSSAWATLLPYSHTIATRVESWLGGVQLVGAVPIENGKITYDDTGDIKRRVKLNVPAATPDRRRWDPAGDPAAPLAAYGQRLHVSTGVRYPNGAFEYMDHGWYLITEWERDESEAIIAVEAVDLAQLIMDDKMPTATAPPPGATFASEFARIVGGIVPTVIDPGLVDRALPLTAVWERERHEAISTLLTAWPARWYVGDDGAAHAAPPYGPVTSTTPPDVVLRDGSGGTVAARARGAQRGALFNVVVVDGKAPDDGSPPPHAELAITDPASPIRATGPYGRVTRFFASDLITTGAQANDTALAILTSAASVGRSEKVKIVPNPAVELGDVARVYTRDGDVYTARVRAMTVPLTADDGPMEVTPGMLPAGVM